MNKNATTAIILICILLLSACGGRGDRKKRPEETAAQYSLADSVVANHRVDTITVENPGDPAPELSIPELPFMVIPPELPEHVKMQRQPRTTPSKTLTVEVRDTVPVRAQIYYYSPRMENKGYSYRKELGGDNNFLGLIDANDMEMISVPDTCEQGAKLMFHAAGCELYELPAEDFLDKNHITVQFKPKTYRSTVILTEKIFRDTISIIGVENLHDTPAKVFYGECLPIYYDDGVDHADPYCAFNCMGCYPEFNFSEFTHLDNLKELTDLYRALKDGADCSLLISVDKNVVAHVETEGFTNGIIEKECENILTRSVRDGYRFEYRLIFTAR